MKTKILEEKENPLFNRREIVFEVISDITPSYSETEKYISEKFNADAKNIKIHHINGKFGVKKFIVDVSIYNSDKDKNNFEITTKKQRDAEKKAREEEIKKLAEEKKKVQEEKKIAEESTKKENTEEKTE
jgi:ribosomal protein S24E